MYPYVVVYSCKEIKKTRLSKFDRSVGENLKLIYNFFGFLYHLVFDLETIKFNLMANI